LVSNPSFEFLSKCPDWDSVGFAKPWFLGPSTDIYAPCIGNVPVVSISNTIYPVNGQNFIGMHVYGSYREYAQVKLTDTLRKSECYFVEAYTRPESLSPALINNVGINFSASSYTGLNINAPLNVPCHITSYNNHIIYDTLKWTRLTGIYKAIGNESYITLGNFNSTASTSSIAGNSTFSAGVGSYYYFDSVSVIPFSSLTKLPWDYTDVIINIGDSAKLGFEMNGLENLKWIDINGNILSNQPVFWVKPKTTQKYIINFSICSKQYTDTLTVFINEFIGFNERKLDRFIEIKPTVTDNFIMATWELNTYILRPDLLELIDNSSRVIKSLKLNWVGNLLFLDLSSYAKGVYTVKLINTFGDYYLKRIIVY